MNYPRVSWRLILALCLPAAIAEALINIYNVYVPLYLQAGNSSLSLGKDVLMPGFGIGASVVGLWLVSDNILGFFLQPLISAWSDHLHTRLGRRLPLILASLPLITLGFASIPFAPLWLGLKTSNPHPVEPFYLLLSTCILFFTGYLPSRALFQTLRQETVAEGDRSKLEAWFFFLFGALTTLALTAGGVLYRVYPPLLFWMMAGLYLLSVGYLLLTFRELPSMVASASHQNANPIAQLKSVFASQSVTGKPTLTLFLASVVSFTAALVGFMNFGSSWLVSLGGVNENQAAFTMGLATLGSTVIALPAGFLASRIWGRRGVYLYGQVLAIGAMVFALLTPSQSSLVFILLGFGFGSAIVAQLPFATDLFHKFGAMGAVVGVFDAAYILGGIIGSLVIGWVVERTSYTSLFVITGIFLLVSIACVLPIKASCHTVQVTVGTQ